MNTLVQTQTGLITSSFGRHYQLETKGGERLLAHPRGKKSEAVVGDCVLWKPSQDEAVIEATLERRNLLYRQDDMRTKAFAANLDQVLIMIAAEPEFSDSQLSRALIACETEGIEALIVLNKADLQMPFQEARKRLEPYVRMGCHIMHCSLQKDSPKALFAALHGKTTLVLGPSGAGKSTLINTLIPDAQAQTGELSHALKSGKHTTTTSQWYWLAQHQGAIIDSPGFQSFGLNHVALDQLAALMPDLREYATQCRFYNCTHLHEPGCAVIAAVERGDITSVRYRIYQEIADELQQALRY